MRFFRLSAMKDLRRYRRDAPALALWFLLPLVIAGLIGSVFGHGDAKPHGLLLIDDEDRGLAGTFLRESISRGPLGGILALQQTDRAEGRRSIDRGDASALLIIPKGYDRAVMLDEPAGWTLITNPEQFLLPGIVREVASANVSAASYLQQVAGTQLRAFEDVPVSVGSVTDFATGLGHSVSGVSTYLQPPRIVVQSTATGNPLAHRRSEAEILFPGIVVLVILMMSAGMSIEIWKEGRAGAVRRVAGTSSGLSGFLAGKLAATGVVLLAAVLVTFGAARAVFGIPMRACGLAIVWSGCAAMVVYCGLLLAQLLLAGERTATTVAGMTMVPLAMLGGSFFPIESMPASFAKVAGFTPNGWMLVQLRSILSAPVAPWDLTRDFAILLAAGAVLFALARRAMERRFVA